MLLITALLATVAAGLAPAAPESQAPATSTADFQPAVSPRAWKSVVLHHSATSSGDVASIDRVHRQQKDAAGQPWLGIGYHFVIGNGHKMRDGEIQPTFRWQKQLAGAHAGSRGHNETGIGICLIGNFEEAAPTKNQLESLARLLKLLEKRYTISPEQFLRHQDVHATACPGRLFPWEQIISDVRGGPKGS